MLNVASPGKTHFSEEELVLLQSVAFQIGMALKRTKLYENEKRRAHYYVKLERFIQDLKRFISLMYYLKSGKSRR